MAKKRAKVDVPRVIDKADYFVGDLLDFVQGGGPVTGLWRAFCEWASELGYSEEEIEECSTEIMARAGRS